LTTHAASEPEASLEAVSEPLVTVMINNFNYARFLRDAIDSALGQSYRNVEVVVVDDGSEDESRAVIASYGTRIVGVYKENGGQASAFNAGFARSRGTIVVFLDSDDILDEGVVAVVVHTFSQRPKTVMVQCRLELADVLGRRLGSFVPARYVRMPTADLRDRPEMMNNVSWWAPTSGIAVRSATLREVLPLPEDLFRISADIGLVRACALRGPVASLRISGGRYRSHGDNYSNSGVLELPKIESDAKRFIDQQRYVSRIATALGVNGYPTDPYSILDTVFLIQRLLLVRLGTAEVRLPGDTRLTTGLQGVRAALCRPDVALPIKGLVACWFVLMVILPRRLAEWLANKTLFQKNLKGSRR
jgi:hypothetical protein